MSTSIFKVPYSISATGSYVLKTGQPDGDVPSLRDLDFDFTTGSFVGTVRILSRPRKTTATARQVAYEAQTLNGSDSDGLLHTDDITGDSSIRVDDSSRELELEVTRVSGTLLVNSASSRGL